MDDFNDEIFGQEYKPTEAAPEVKIFLPLSDFLNPNPHNCSFNNPTNIEQTRPPNHFSTVQRKISLTSSFKLNRKSQAGRSIDYTQDNSDYNEFQNSLLKKQKNSHQLKTLTSDLQFCCPLCRGMQGRKGCFACKGAGLANGANNFSKFFEYVMEFKMGVKESYENRKTRQVQNQPVNQFCGDFYQSQMVGSLPPKIRNIRMSDNLHESHSSSFFEYKKKLLQKKNIHRNYKCDGCEEDPIKGSRFHCTHADCQGDYDLCQQCYAREEHRHPMEEIKQTKAAEHLEILSSFVGKLKDKKKMGSSRAPIDYKSYGDNRIFYSSIH